MQLSLFLELYFNTRILPTESRSWGKWVQKPNPDTKEKLDFHPQGPALVQLLKVQTAVQSTLGWQKSAKTSTLNEAKEREHV